MGISLKTKFPFPPDDLILILISIPINLAHNSYSHGILRDTGPVTPMGITVICSPVEFDLVLVWRHVLILDVKSFV